MLFNAAILVAALSSSQDALSGDRGDRGSRRSAAPRARQERIVSVCPPGTVPVLSSETALLRDEGKQGCGRERGRQRETDGPSVCSGRSLAR